MGLILLIVGVILGVGGGLWLLVAAFQESILWGVGVLLLPFLALVFAVMHWEEAKRPFLVAVAGNVLAIAGAAMNGPQ